MLRVLLLFSVFLLVNGQAGEVTTNVTYSGTPAACSNICNETIYMAEMACNNDTASWGNGTKEFLDPVPAGNIVYNISAILNFNFGCTNITSTDGFATIDGELIDFLPQLTDSADCSCSNCMQNITLSKNYPDGWPNYVYGGLNTFKLWYKPFICLSLVTLNIGYDISQPKLTSYHPTAIPTSTAATIFVSGEDFLPSNILFCNFGGELTNATYVNANQITCPAFVSDTANSTEFQLVDSRQNILDGGEFTWYIQPTVLSMDPTSSMSTVSTNVTLTGSNFFNSSSAVCKFGNIPFFDIDFISDTTVVCLNIKDVQSDPRNVSVSFSENGFNYVTTSLTYEFTGTNFPNTSPTVSVSPSASPSEVSQNPAVPPFVWAAIGILVLICCILMIGGSSIAYQNKKKKAYSNVFGDDLLPPAHEPSRTISNALASDPNIIPFSELTGLKQIEKGSFGVIYEASWRGIQIAVKKLPATMTEKQLTEFRQEAALMKSLRHPNILQYLGISQTNDRAPCICMEYMPLGSLYRILHMPKSDFDRSRIRSVCLDTCRGMNYLHQQHPPIIHRDLKSHNLLVDRHWQVKVCDFGLSRITEQNQTMTACGTPSWTAPEVLRNERYTTKADVYGFGIVIWEMFARADPFPEMPPFQIVFAVGTQKLRPRIDQRWPEEWINLMTSCWNEDQQARPTFETLITIIEGLPDPR